MSIGRWYMYQQKPGTATTAVDRSIAFPASKIMSVVPRHLIDQTTSPDIKKPTSRSRQKSLEDMCRALLSKVSRVSLQWLVHEQNA